MSRAGLLLALVAVSVTGCATADTRAEADAARDPGAAIAVDAPPADPTMTRSDGCGSVPDGFSWPVLAGVLSATADAAGTLVLVDRGSLSGVALCHRAAICSGAVHGVVIGVSEGRAELRFAVPPTALAGCDNAIISRDPDSGPGPRP
ncbi:MAG: hypothetical protein CVU56_13610 [Deltaproteobacteria bacterium HGW-Deltaproteobacteria-14]|nr:MAG: hypothetical protein CVU56_13610 [Deltaproteobacteria bacterium HGW-Deltaproteobacteria-14]